MKLLFRMVLFGLIRWRARTWPHKAILFANFTLKTSEKKLIPGKGALNVSNISTSEKSMKVYFNLFLTVITDRETQQHLCVSRSRSIEVD